MAQKTQFHHLGVDVAKDWLDIFDGKTAIRIANTPEAITTFLKRLDASTAIAIESTSYYHEKFVELAFKDKQSLYLIDAYRLSRYRDAVGCRIKTDVTDAQLLWRYLQAEKSNLIPFKPIPKAIKSLNQLLKARAKLAKAKKMISSSLDHIKVLKQERSSVLEHIDQAMSSIAKRIERQVEQAGLKEDYQRCLSIPGVGVLNAASMVATYHRGDFHSSDAFIAFMGLDVQVRESGYYRGKRKLTKRGNPETRRLLFNAARSGSRTSTWNAYYLSLLQKGHSTTAAAVVLSRKLARVAFALLKNQTEFMPNEIKNA